MKVLRGCFFCCKWSSDLVSLWIVQWFSIFSSTLFRYTSFTSPTLKILLIEEGFNPRGIILGTECPLFHLLLVVKSMHHAQHLKRLINAYYRVCGWCATILCTKLDTTSWFSIKYPMQGCTLFFNLFPLSSCHVLPPRKVRRAADMTGGRRRGSLGVGLSCQGCSLWQWLPVDAPPDSLCYHK